MNSNKIGEVGVRFCASCEHNLKCSECTIKHEYEAMLEKLDAFFKRFETLREENCQLESRLKDRECKIRELEAKLSEIEVKREEEWM